MDRRVFLSGMLGLTGATLVASLVGSGKAIAGVPATGGGILGELDASLPDLAVGSVPEVEEVQYRGRDRDRRDRRGRDRRPRRRPVWRTVCRRFRSGGRWRRRCWRERVWV